MSEFLLLDRFSLQGQQPEEDTAEIRVVLLRRELPGNLWFLKHLPRSCRTAASSMCVLKHILIQKPHSMVTVFVAIILWASVVSFLFTHCEVPLKSGKINKILSVFHSEKELDYWTIWLFFVMHIQVLINANHAQSCASKNKPQNVVMWCHTWEKY